MAITGTGTSKNPYKIGNAVDFLTLGKYFRDLQGNMSYFELTADIDFSAYETIYPIGHDRTGSWMALMPYFNGNGFTIKNANIIASAVTKGNDNIGLIINTRSGRFENTNFENIHVDHTITIRGGGAGVVIGSCEGTYYRNCNFIGCSVSAYQRASSFNGSGTTSVSNSYSDTILKVTRQSDTVYLGGMIYTNLTTGTSRFATNCIFNGELIYGEGITNKRFINPIGFESITHTGTTTSGMDCYYNTDKIEYENLSENLIGYSTNEFKNPDNFPPLITVTTPYWGHNGKRPYLLAFTDIDIIKAIKKLVEVTSTVSKITSNVITDVFKIKKQIETVRSFISSIESNVNHSKSKSINTNSYVKPIETSSARHKRTIARILTHLKRIETGNYTRKRKSINLTFKSQSITSTVSRKKSRIQQVSSYMNPIVASSILNLFKQMVVQVISSISPIYTNTDNTKKKVTNARSHIEPIQTHTSHSKKRYKETSSYVSSINTNTVIGRVKNKLINVGAWSKAIAGRVTSKIGIYIKPKIKEINVDVSYISNQSSIQAINHSSPIESIVHASRADSVIHTSAVQVVSHHSTLKHNGGD